MTNSLSLSPKQIIAIDALLRGQNKAQAATTAGVSRQTMSRWQAIPKFKQALVEGEGELLASLNRSLLALAQDATTRLALVIQAPDTQSVGVRAADVVLSRLLAIRELTEIEARLTALEGGTNELTADK